MEQHINTTKHKRSKEYKATVGENRDNSANNSSFYSELCEAMVAINMPWRNLNNSVWKDFLQKYTKRPIPDESTLRKNYLEQIYQRRMQEIRESIGDSFVWISVDETTDSTGRYIANLIIGKMCEEEPTVPYLIACKQLEQTNHVTIARFVNDALLALWPHGNAEKVLLLVTDVAAYMLKAGENLKIFFPNMLHLTCYAHGLNRVAETIRQSFPLVNNLISSVKKVFLKAPLRIQQYRLKLGDVPLPPEPVITRWGTWLEAALFYADYFDSIKEVCISFIFQK